MLGVQLYTLRDYLDCEENVRMTAKRLKTLGCNCVQLFHGDEALEKMCDIFSSEGFNIIGTLSRLDKLESNPDLFDICKKYGLKDIGISSSAVTDEEAADVIVRANSLADKAIAHGLTFSYHNHANEFTRLPSGKTVMGRFLDEFNQSVTFMPDTYWLQTGGADVREWIKNNGSRISMLHLKDMTVIDRSPTFAEIGQGNMSFSSIIDTAKSVGIDTFVIEQDLCQRDSFESVEISIEYLRGIL